MKSPLTYQGGKSRLAPMIVKKIPTHKCYVEPFCHGDYLRLRSALDQIKGKFLLSLNDHPKVREIFKGFKFQRVTLKYSIGRSAESREKTRGEVLIQNY